jgi:hypothetical protein
VVFAVDVFGVFFVELLGVLRSLALPRDTLEELDALSDFGVFSWLSFS